ncbi:hypothetical protein WAF17_16775 [Bernardetia sp. ABR2-2B]|uniref:hypothetical protein n=1 Tax=Bernardetia sp. ABR2-2B TaxID=3127472 RepID=UPI0030CD0447
MNPQEFIKLQLDKIIEHIPYIQLRYEYDKLCHGHYVEVLPYSYYKNDKTYLEMEEKFYRKFRKLFPNEAIGFLSEKSLSSIKNPEYFRKGSLYDMQRLAETANYADIAIFTTHKVGSLLSATAYNTLKETKANTKIDNIYFHKESNSVENVLDYIHSNAAKEPDFSGEENAFAAAA